MSEFLNNAAGVHKHFWVHKLNCLLAQISKSANHMAAIHCILTGKQSQVQTEHQNEKSNLSNSELLWSFLPNKLV